MKITVIGLGKLGLCIACTLAKHYKVIGIDTNSKHINLLRNGINNIKEYSLSLWYSLYRKNMLFMDDYTNLSNFIFIVVPTPSKEDGSFTSKYIENALERYMIEQICMCHLLRSA